MLLPSTRRELERAIRDKFGVGPDLRVAWFELRAKVGAHAGADGLLGVCDGHAAFAARSLTGQESWHLWEPGDIAAVAPEHSAFDERLRLRLPGGDAVFERLDAQAAKAVHDALLQHGLLGGAAATAADLEATLTPGQALCADCGSVNERHYMFCAQCGRDLGAEHAIAGVPEEGEVLELIVTMEPTAEALPPEQRPGAFRCPRCRHPCAAQAVFCVNCGLDLTAGTITRSPRKGDDGALPAPTPHLDPGKRVPEKCPTCGEAVAAHYAVCRSCGAVVKALSVTGTGPEFAAKPRLQVLAGPYAGQSFPLPERKIIIGRSEASDITLEADDVSRSHAVLAPEAGKWRVSDLSSANGTKVNGKVVAAPTELGHGDRIRVGLEHELRFLLGPDDVVEAVVAPAAPDGTVKARRRRRRKTERSVVVAMVVVVAAVVAALVLALAGR